MSLDVAKCICVIFILDDNFFKMSQKTRAKSAVYGVGVGLTECDAEIKGARPPTNKQVLRCILYEQSLTPPPKTTLYEVAKRVLPRIKIKYDMEKISDSRAIQLMVALVNKNKKTRQINSKKRKTEFGKNKLDEEEQFLNQTFPLWKKEPLSFPEDRLFIESMKTDRKASIGGVDRKTAKKLQNKKAREDAENKRREKAQAEMLNNTSEYIESSSDEIPHSEIDSDTDIPNISEPKVKNSFTGTTAFIPADILSRPKVVAIATRFKISPAAQAAFTKAIIEESNGDVSKIKSSYATADRARRKVATDIAENVKQEWSCPEPACLHWDSKLNKDLNNPYIKVERLSILVGNRDDLKFLGAPSYMPGTDEKSGEIISRETMAILNAWLLCRLIVAMVFDTTSANTGHITAACISIQIKLERALLWTPCRHHIGEVILTHVWDDLNIETDKSPEISLFVRFRNNYGSLPHSDENTVFQIFNRDGLDEQALAFIDQCVDETTEILTPKIKFSRSDYREFGNLTLVYLGTKERVKLMRPGAMHKVYYIYQVPAICMLNSSTSL